MKSKWLTTLLIMIIVAAVFGLGYHQASGKNAQPGGVFQDGSGTPPTPEAALVDGEGGSNIELAPIEAQAPIDEPASAEAIVSGSFTYQGALKENGVAVTGDRQMIFRLYSANDCSAGLLVTQGPQTVAVKDGLFNVVLNFSTSYFTGEARALRVYVAGTPVGCSLIRPTPYALSLRPGATISGAIPSGDVLFVYNTSTGNYGNGLRGNSKSSGGAGVVGISTHASGYGVWAANIAGVALYAYGDIKSSEDTTLILSPHGLVERDGATLLDMQPQENGAMLIKATSAGARFVSLPVQAPGVLLGSRFYVKSLEVCYLVDEATTYVWASSVIHYIPPNTYGIYTMDSTAHNNTTMQCYTSTDASPDPIEHATWVQFNLNSTATVMDPALWTIFEIKLTLTQAP